MRSVCLTYPKTAPVVGLETRLMVAVQIQMLLAPIPLTQLSHLVMVSKLVVLSLLDLTGKRVYKF